MKNDVHTRVKHRVKIMLKTLGKEDISLSDVHPTNHHEMNIRNAEFTRGKIFALNKIMEEIEFTEYLLKTSSPKK